MVRRAGTVWAVRADEDARVAAPGVARGVARYGEGWALAFSPGAAGDR